jgi:hypothetical protein
LSISRTSDTFGGWLRSGGSAGKLFFALIWAAALFLFTQSFPALRVARVDVTVAADVLNAVLAAGLLAATLIRRPHVDEVRFPKASAAIARFYTLWRLNWASALALALAILAFRFVSAGRWAGPLINTLASAQILFLFLCFFALYQPFSKEPPLRRPLLVGVILGALLVLDVLRVKTGHPMLALVPWLLRALYGMSIMLLAGRLSSKFIEAPIPLLAALGAYAVVQLATPGPEFTLLIVLAGVVLTSLFFLAFQWPVQGGVLLYAMNRLHGLKNLVPHERKDFVGWVGWPLPPANSPSGVALCLRVITGKPVNAPLYFHLRIRNNTGKPLALGLWSLNDSALSMDMGEQSGLILAVRNAAVMKGIPNTVSIEAGDWTEIRVPYAAWEIPATLLSASVAQNKAKDFKFVGSLTLLSPAMTRPATPEVAVSNPAGVEVIPG